MRNISYLTDLQDLQKYIFIDKSRVNEKRDTLSSDTCYHPNYESYGD